MKQNGSVHIGTSGWHYDHWKGPFYPESLAGEEFLKHYTRRFQTVEVPQTFYQTPRDQTLIRWRDSVPKGFIFSIIANRYITHMKELRDPQQTVPPFLKRLEVLGEKLGPILFQLPPDWSFNCGRLQAFLRALSKDYRYAFEFRNPSCFSAQVYDALEDYGAAFCIYDLGGQLSPRIVTTDLVYIRLYSPGNDCSGQYGSQALSGWADTLSAWVERGKQVYCYFDNDQEGYAPQDAAILRRLIESKSELPFKREPFPLKPLALSAPPKTLSEEIFSYVQKKISRYRG